MLVRSETLFGISACHVRQWGSFALLDASRTRDLTPRSRKARAILAYLVSHPGTKIPRERLSELLWGDRPDAHARASLRQALLEIRHATELPFVEADREHVWIPAERILPETADEPDDSPLFDDLNHLTPEFDAWLAMERNRRTAEVLDGQRREVERLLAAGRGADAIPLLDRMTRLDPYDETTLSLAMRAECQAKRPSALQQRYQETEARNREEFGVGLPAEIRALHDRLLEELTGDGGHRGEHEGGEQPPPFRAAEVQPPRSSPVHVLMSIVLALSILGAQYLFGSTAAAATPPSLAVLPFRALGGVDPYLVDGFSEELLSDLARHPDLRVTGRTSAWLYKDKAGDLRQIGRNLRVGYIVEGSVRKSGERLLVTAALVNSSDGRTVWTQRFDGPTGLGAPIHASIGQGIRGALNVGEEQVASRVPRQDAYQLYLRAKGLFRERDKASTIAARELLEQAVRMDPGFAPAWALLGGTIQLGPMAGDEDWRRKALAATGRALALDPNSAEAHAMRALVLGTESAAGRAHLARSMALNPNDPQTVYWWGGALAESADYRLQERAVSKAAQLDPLWHRPVSAAIEWAAERGDHAAASRYLAVMRKGNPAAAVVAEIALARSTGDLSRVVALARQRNVRVPTSMLYEACEAWIGLGRFDQCASTGAQLSSTGYRLLNRRPVTAAEIAAEARVHGDPWLLELAVWELLRTGRYDQLVGLTRIPDTRLSGLDEIRLGNRVARLTNAGRIALALEKLGRKAQALRYWKAADEAGRYALRSRNIPDEDVFAIAANEAAQGRKDRALTLLAGTDPRRWNWLNRVHGDIGEDPMLASLRGVPAFEKLRREHLAWRTRERREADALISS
ncbi:BTAD domain-containing putative transcriptional regulator [Sphingomonas sp. GCM10030256]|uniref:BTAD domain-containing putative transcriptional regulator n=1 Tax=Sphingomonas sp. GCM10030256 TaxID=3273427 RepID=UPI00360BC493